MPCSRKAATARSRDTVSQSVMAATIKFRPLAIALVLEAAVAEVTLAVEEDGPRESVSGLAFVQANLDTPAEFGGFHPLQHKE